jgi:hypothetical protein
MEMRFNLDSCTTLVISDRAIADPRPNYGHGHHGDDRVSVQLVHMPLSLGREGDPILAPDFVQNISLKPSEARTIASALMTAAQSAR